MKYLIIIDAQNDFCAKNGVLSSKEAVKAIDNLVAILPGMMSEGDLKIVCTQDTHDINTYLNTQEGRNLGIKHCLYQHEGWCLRSDLYATLFSSKYVDNVVLLNKNAFGYYEWREYFGNLSSDNEFILCGVDSDICVISNALILKAAYPEIKISVLKNCVAGTSIDANNAALKVMESCQIEII